MKQILAFIKKSLSMSRNEAIGTLFLFILLFVSWLIIKFSDGFFLDSQTDISIITTQDLDSLNVPRQTYFKKNYGSGYKSTYSEKNYTDKAETFAFNPNNASVEELKRLGIPPKVAYSIDKYRSKNGKFRYKEDLMKMYDFPVDVYERLEAVIELPSRENHSIETPQAEYSGSFEKETKSNEPSVEAYAASPKYISKPKNVQPFDLNTADTTKLMQIRGIGKATAEKIIKFRESFGGFYTENQVRETYNLPPETADELLKYASIKTGVRKIYINKIDLKDFRFGGLSYNQRKAIVNYREQHGGFKSIDDLRKIRILDEASITKIAPYLEF